MKSFLFSQLAQHLARLGPEQFRATYPHDWLVWEPGTWKPPQRNQGTLIIPAQSAAAKAASATAGEALVFALVPKAGREGQLALGRGEGCEICINDATLSQTHLVLTQAGIGWVVRDAGSSNGSWVNGVKLTPGTPAMLVPGSQIRAAQVAFTYLGPTLMISRLQAQGSPSRPTGG